MGGILGMLLYTLIKARNNLNKEDFNIFILINENLSSWVLSLFILVVLSIIINIDPESVDGLYEAIGVSFEASFKGFLLLGTFLAFGSKEATK